MTSLDTHKKVIESLVLSEYRQTKNFMVEYWENRHDPESDYHAGINKSDKIRQAKEDLQDSKSVSFNELQKYHTHDFCLCLRGAMRKLYLEAQDFCENPFIKIGNLKRVVLMRNLLNTADSEYIIYSTYYLINVKNRAF